MKIEVIKESKYKTVEVEETKNIIILEFFSDLYDENFVESLKDLLKEYNKICVSYRDTSYIRLSKELEKEFIRKMKVDESVLIKLKDDFILKIHNSDVRDGFGSFGYTSIYFSEYKQPEILTLEAFCSRTNKFYRENISPLDDINNFKN